ncbi:MAG: ABC transporter ATP-binding protein [Dinoroseobacter sp.]|nr:ABC transporter ATP-binding protein [Dinoroseobacter sp.]
MSEGSGLSGRVLARRVWRDALSHRKALIFTALLLMAIEGGMLGALSYLLRPMFDQVFVAGDMAALWWVGLSILGLFIIRGMASVGQKVLLTRAIERGAARLQSGVLAHVMGLDGRFHQTHPPGQLIERVQGDVMTMKESGAAIITGLGRDVIGVVSLLGVALWIDPIWTLVALLGVPVLIAPSALAQKYTRDRVRTAREIAAAMSTRLDEIFHGIAQIKLNRLERGQSERYDSLLDTRVNTETQAALGKALIPGLIDVMTGIGFLGVLYFGGREIIAGEKTVGEFMSFFTAMALMFEPLRRLGMISGLWQAVAAALDRLYGLYDTKASITSPARAADVPVSHQIAFNDVHLAYDDTPVLRGCSFTAEPGQTTALVGASGAGKSTIFNALTRLVDPSTGDITLGGTRVNELSLSDLRAQFSVVTQDALLFDESLRDNILLGMEDPGEDRLNAALKDAHVAEFLPKLPKGIDSQAGPRGSALSGGQRQRVAIARALLRDAPVLLLDEATSALDAESEAVVQEALDRLSRGRTTLVIAHRLSTIRAADKIVVMDRGRVVEEGSHSDLLAKSGVYAGLHALQFSEEST